MNETKETEHQFQKSYVPRNTTGSACDLWKFIYGGKEHEGLHEQYPHGFYKNLLTKEIYSFQRGIKSIIGEKNEDIVYNIWWIENS
jgi:hypothetical protein